MKIIAPRWKRAAIVCATLFVASDCIAQMDVPAVKMKGTEIPAPRAGQWTPPEQPQPLAEVTGLVFNLGMADPTGGEYRQIKLELGQGYGSWVQLTHGWVLPADEKSPQRFAVCWDGLVHPVTAVGAPCDVDKDMEVLIGKLDAVKGKGFIWEVDAFSSRVVSWRNWSSTKCALLLRIGKKDLATRLWDASRAMRDEKYPKPPSDIDSVYREIAVQWMFMLYADALAAYQRGDDHLAVAQMRLLAKLAPDVRKTAAKLHGKAYAEDDPYIFVDENPKFAAEVERRVSEPPRKTALETGLDKYPDKAERIKALIQDLDQVDVRQNGQPGSVILSESPIVQALIAEGDAAVEPLLDCVEHDTRFTRSVGYARDFFTKGRHVISVNSAAYVALTNIFGRSFDDVDPWKDGWPATAAVMRAYWEKRKGTPREEQWFITLADDNAKPQEWLDAAGNMTRPRNIQYQRSGGWQMWRTMPGGDTSMSGEPLRAKTGPSVTDLLKKRIEELPGRKEEEERKTRENYKTAMALADVLLDWDAKEGIEPGRKICNATVDHFKDTDPSDYSEDLASPVVSLVLHLAAAGDEKIVADDARWLKEIPLEQLRSLTRDHLREWFYPLAKFHDTPAMRDAAAYLFADEHSSWRQFYKAPGEWKEKQGWQNKLDLFSSPIIVDEAFRKIGVEGLSDQTPIGGLQLDAGRFRVMIGEPGSLHELFSQNPNDPGIKDLPSQNFPFRVCDAYMWKLTGLEGMPEFKLYWPEKKRDEAISRCAELLQRYGARYVVEQERKGHGFPENWRMKLAFARLDHAATPDDVKAGRAIFSLPTGEKATVSPMKEFPLAAHWTKLDDASGKAPAMSSSTAFYVPGKPVPQQWPANDGHVWQAEEGIVSGKRVRFYGYVSEHSVVCAPATEIEFEGDGYFGRFESGLNFTFDFGKMDWKPMQIGQPMIITAGFYNRKATEVKIPQTLYRADEKALADGVTIRLYRKQPQEWVEGDVDERTGGRDESASWLEVPMKKVVRFKIAKLDHTLGPAEKWEAMDFDLRDLFDIDKAGEYCFAFSFEKEGVKFYAGPTPYANLLIK